MAEKKYTFLFNGSAWFLKLDNLDDLNAYHSMVWDIRMDDYVHDMKREREKQHPVSDIADMCILLGRLKGTNSWAEFQRLEQTQHRQMSHMIIEGHVLYVNPAGGYTMDLEDIRSRYDADEMRWPVFREDDIRVKQWPGGAHYYAYIGPVQVTDGSTVKWESESDARMAAMEYVTTKKRLK